MKPTKPALPTLKGGFYGPGDEHDDQAPLPVASEKAAVTETAIPVISGKEPFAIRIGDCAYLIEPRGFTHADIGIEYGSNYYYEEDVTVRLRIELVAKRVTGHHD